MNPDNDVTPGMVAVARFHDMEEVESFRAIAMECGVPTRVADVRRGLGGFDFTLGASAQFLGWAVMVAEPDVPVLEAHLTSQLEIDPMDPMNTAPTPELSEIVNGPLTGNLWEKITARRILESRAVPVEPVAASGVADSHVDGDERLARWLGAVGWTFTIIYLAIVISGLFPNAPPTYEEALVLFAPGAQGYVEYTGDPFADDLRPFILTVIPMATGLALFLSRRQLRSGLVRPMFPPFWRATGRLHFWLPAVTMILFAVGRKL